MWYIRLEKPNSGIMSARAVLSVQNGALQREPGGLTDLSKGAVFIFTKHTERYSVHLLGPWRGKETSITSIDVLAVGGVYM